MANVLSHLEPVEVFSFFETLSDIPRGSANEKAVSDWFIAFAKARGLECHQDSYHNICIKKPGTPGYENAPPVILHGHMDMVCKKEEGVDHDFLKDSLELVIKDGFIEANGTTLGADNGIGISYFLAVFDSKDIPHPPLEMAITVMEEMGKVGGENFDATLLSGKRMIDLNWHLDDHLLAGCGGDATVKYDINLELEPRDANTRLFFLGVGGLKGGHCEFDIVLERANSIKVLGRLLNNITKAGGVKVVSMCGGVQNNVIPAESNAILAINPSQVGAVEDVVANTFAELKDEYAVTDPAISVTLAPWEGESGMVFTDKTTQLAVGSILLIPNGVISMSFKIKGISECSNNLGLMTMEDGKLSLMTTITSSVTTRKHEVMKQIFALADLLGGQVTAVPYGCDAPEWVYNPDSQLLAVSKAAYTKLFGEAPKIEVMPASLELGLFQGKIPGLDIISIGTETHGVHTPEEKLRIASVDKVWRLFKEVLAALK